MSPNIVRSVCPYDCPDTCGLLVEVEDGRAVRVSGDPAHPLTRGFEVFAEKVLTGCAPERMSPVCGLPDAVIERMAREFVAATAPFVRLGSGLTRYGNGAP
jgi:anaerobic selenocysteine-containing dehydrogenase